MLKSEWKAKYGTKLVTKGSDWKKQSPVEATYVSANAEPAPLSFLAYLHPDQADLNRTGAEGRHTSRNSTDEDTQQN